MKIGIIGMGVMGQALAHRLGGDLLTCDRNREKGEIQDPNELITQVDLVILAVKPQSFEELAQSLTADASGKLILSIMTGITIEKMGQVTGSKRIVRTMPNLAIRTGEGVTGWVASAGLTAADRTAVEQLLGRLGVQVELSDESHLDAVTAISGSGPAYFFYLTELLAAAAERLGIPSQEAHRLAEGTLISSGSLLSHGTESAEEWRKAITVKGGTTHAALEVLQQEPFGKLLTEATAAAHRRAQELGS